MKKAFRRKNIDMTFDMTESGFNLLNDMNYYSLSKCDMIFDSKGKCHWIDPKFITQKNLIIIILNMEFKMQIIKAKILGYEHLISN